MQHQNNFQVKDRDIFHQVCESLTLHPRLNSSQIEVSIHEGRVHLKGQVPGRIDKREAERCIETIPGVKIVTNELEIDS